MKNLIQTMLFFLLLSQICFAQWVLTNAPKNVPIYTFAYDGSNVFAGGDTSYRVATGGTVFHSTNNVLDWEIIGIDTDCPEVRSIVIDDENIYAGTRGGGVFLSTNMGASWTNISNGLTDLDVYTLLITPNGLGGKNLYAGTMGGGIFISTNNGINWSSVNNGLTYLNISSLAYLKNQVNEVILFAGTYNGLFVSTNYGENWSQRANTQYFEYVAVSGENVFAAAIMHLWFSTDLGLSWTDVTTGLRDLPVWALATYGTNVFALTNWGGIFLSTNNGENWKIINEGIIDTLVLAIGINDTYIFASGVAEGLWRRPLSELVTMLPVENTTELPKEFALYQNYPNPFNPSTTLSFVICHLSFITLKVYDVLGREVTTLVNEEKPAGTYEIKWNATNLPSGVYFYKIQAGSFIETKKMILVK